MYVFGKKLSDTIEDITPTYLTPRVLKTLRHVDAIAHKVLRDSGNNVILPLQYNLQKCDRDCVRNIVHILPSRRIWPVTIGAGPIKIALN